MDNNAGFQLTVREYHIVVPGRGNALHALQSADMQAIAASSGDSGSSSLQSASQQINAITSNNIEGGSSSSAVDSEKPSYSVPKLIVQALDAAPEKKLQLQEIYASIKNKYPYYRSPENIGWMGRFVIIYFIYCLFINSIISFYSVKTSLSKSGFFVNENGFWKLKPTYEKKLVEEQFQPGHFSRGIKPI